MMRTELLTYTRKPRMRRVRPEQQLRLTGSQREALELLHEYGFLTPRLLALAYGSRQGRDGKGYWHLLRELRRLYDAGLVERFPSGTRLASAGSEECIYAITHAGGRAILDPAEYTEMRHDLYNRENKGRANFAHHVAIATLQLILTLGQYAWHLLEFEAEARNPGACVKVRVRNQQLTFWPDARAVLETGREGTAQRRWRYLFEIDLTRKNSQRIADRFLAYAAYLAERQTGRTSPSERGAAVFVVSSEREAERFMEIAAEVVAARSDGAKAPFLFWNMQDWYEGHAVGSGDRAEGSIVAERPGGILRSPREILSQASLTTISGESRRLV